MIEFGCPHCGKQLFHQDAFAGRDGWCRFCKGIITIPHAGQTATLPTLTPDQRYAQLERMFKHAASIVDEHRQLQARLQHGGTGLVEELRLRTEAQRETATLHARLEEVQRAQRAADADRERLQARITELDQYGAELRKQIETDAEGRKRLESDLEAARTDAERIPAIEEAHAETRTALDEQLKENDALLERLLDVEQSLETTSQQASAATQAWDAERAAFEKRLEGLRDELCAAEDEGVEQKERLAEADETTARLQSELESAHTASNEAQNQLRAEIDRLTAALESETLCRRGVEQTLAETVPVADRVPALEAQVNSLRSEIAAANARREEALRAAAGAERAGALAEKRAADARAAWDTQRQELLDEIESFRDAQRASEEETAAIRAKSREAAAELQARIDTLESDRANEVRLRAAAEESAQRAQRRAAEAETALDDAQSRRDALSRQLESARADLETERATSTQRNADIVEMKASMEALRTRLRESQGERDRATEGLSRVTGELQSAQRINEQLQKRAVDLEELLSTATEPDAAPSEPESFQAEVEGLLQKVAELEDALAASQREKYRLEQRLVSAENRAAYSELEGVGYRSQFSSMAKQFFEQEVARQSGAHHEDRYSDESDTLHRGGEAGASSVLDAVSELRR